MNAEVRLLLAADLRRQLQEIARIHDSLQGFGEAQWTAMECESLGYRLHNYYCSWEDLFLIVARHFENHIEGMDRYHIALLRRMSTEMPGIRPALIKRESNAFRVIDELRSFRHFFRHAYGSELDARKLRILLDDLQSARAELFQCGEDFLEDPFT